MGTFPKNSGTIDVQRPAPDVPSFQPGPAHTCPDPFDDQVPLQFCDSPMMMTTARPSGPPVSRFSRKLTNSMPRWLSSSSTSRKVPDRPRDSIRGPDQDYLEAAAPGIPQQITETRPTCFSP